MLQQPWLACLVPRKRYAGATGKQPGPMAVGKICANDATLGAHLRAWREYCAAFKLRCPLKFAKPHCVCPSPGECLWALPALNGFNHCGPAHNGACVVLRCDTGRSVGASVSRGQSNGRNEPASTTPKNGKIYSISKAKNGAACVTRTRDPRITNAVLYRLS